jgi:paraquat-inducible protein A
MCRICSYPLTKLGHGRYECERCGNTESHSSNKSVEMTISLTVTAFIFLIPANLLPFMTIELYGNTNSATIWQGTRSLAESGALFIAIVVFLASIFIPITKLLILLYISLSSNKPTNLRIKTKLYHFIESIGRWSMLDIFLLAVMVSIMKLGPWTRVEPGPGALFFLLVVIFTMLASSYFDTRLIWKDVADLSEKEKLK